MDFSDRREAQARLVKDILRCTTAPRERARWIATGCVDAFVEAGVDSQQSLDVRVVLPGSSWVIRDDELKLFETFWLAVNASAASHFFQQPLTVVAAAGILSATATLVRTIIRKGAFLRTDECLVLLALKRSSEPQTCDQIALAVDLTRDDVNAVLSDLGRVRCGDGTTIAVVAQASDGRWASAGV